MNLHGKKMVAPIIIALLTIGYYAAIGVTLTIRKVSFPFNILVYGSLIGITVLVVFVMVQRIREIRKGEEDDLGQY